jgi:hypothetical protein
MVTYTDEDNLVCSITEAEHKDSAGVIVTQPVSSLLRGRNRQTCFQRSKDVCRGDP